MTRNQFLSLIVATAILGAMSNPTPAVPPDTKSGKEVDPPKDLEPNLLKLPTRKEAMQMKLKSIQSILEGIALSDFDKIRAASEEMVMVSKTTNFLNSYKGKEFQFHVELMRRPAEAIVVKAKEKNMDGVMVSYNELTLSCLKCHQAMRDNKFELVNLSSGATGR